MGRPFARTRHAQFVCYYAAVVVSIVALLVGFVACEPGNGEHVWSSTVQPVVTVDQVTTMDPSSTVTTAPSVTPDPPSTPTPAMVPSPTMKPSTPTSVTNAVTPAPAQPVPTATPSSLSLAPHPSNVVVTAAVSNPSPSRQTEVTVIVNMTSDGQPVSGVPMTATWHYKTTSPTCSGTTDANGTAACTRYIANATLGYTVTITIALTWNGQTYIASTSFTPK